MVSDPKCYRREVKPDVTLMARIGYAKVNSPDQNPGIQSERLKAAGCAVVRPGTVIGFLWDGEKLVVCRLGRSTRDVLNLVHEPDVKGAALRGFDPEVTTASAG